MDQAPPPDDVPAVSAEEIVVGGDEVVAVQEEGPRRYPSTLGGAFYLVVLAVAVTGVVLVVLWEWRRGIQVLAGSLLFAALVRLVLPERDAGMLAVRNRFLDAFWLLAMGAALVFLSISIPNQPGM